MSCISLDAIKRLFTPDALQESLERLESLRLPGLWEARHEAGRYPFSVPLNPHLTVSNEMFGPVAVLLDAPNTFSVDGEPPKFIDLGCGCGRPSLEASHRGWSSLGVDVDQDSVNAANELAKRGADEGFISPSMAPTFAHNNFYPEGFERTYPPGFNPHSVFIQEGEATIDYLMAHCTVARANYEAAGFGLDKIDVFYHYQLESLENLLRFFSRYAKVGALFVLVGSSAQEKAANIFESSQFPRLDEISSAVMQCYPSANSSSVRLFFKHPS